MNDMNYVVLEGKLAHDPEFRVIDEETQVCRFTIAVNRYVMDRATGEYVDRVNYFLIETWGKVAASCAKYLQKGRGVRVVGRLKQVTWKDKRFADMPMERVFIYSEFIEFFPPRVKADEPKEINSKDENSKEADSAQAHDEMDEDVMTAETEVPSDVEQDI